MNKSKSSQCAYCNKSFIQKYENDFFCSVECATLHYHSLSYEQKEDIKFFKNHREFKEVTCLICNKKFIDFKVRNKHFCSDECKIIYNKFHSKKLIKKCKYCETEFTSTVTRKKQFCSTKCAVNYRNLVYSLKEEYALKYIKNEEEKYLKVLQSDKYKIYKNNAINILDGGYKINLEDCELLKSKNEIQFILNNIINN